MDDEVRPYRYGQAGLAAEVDFEMWRAAFDNVLCGAATVSRGAGAKAVVSWAAELADAAVDEIRRRRSPPDGG